MFKLFIASSKYDIEQIYPQIEDRCKSEEFLQLLKLNDITGGFCSNIKDRYRYKVILFDRYKFWNISSNIIKDLEDYKGGEGNNNSKAKYITEHKYFSKKHKYFMGSFDLLYFNYLSKEGLDGEDLEEYLLIQDFIIDITKWSLNNGIIDDINSVNYHDIFNLTQFIWLHLSDIINTDNKNDINNEANLINDNTFLFEDNYFISKNKRMVNYCFSGKKIRELFYNRLQRVKNCLLSNIESDIPYNNKEESSYDLSSVDETLFICPSKVDLINLIALFKIYNIKDANILLILPDNDVAQIYNALNSKTNESVYSLNDIIYHCSDLSSYKEDRKNCEKEYNDNKSLDNFSALRENILLGGLFCYSDKNKHSVNTGKINTDSSKSVFFTKKEDYMLSISLVSEFTKLPSQDSLFNLLNNNTSKLDKASIEKCSYNKNTDLLKENTKNSYNLDFSLFFRSGDQFNIRSVSNNILELGQDKHYKSDINSNILDTTIERKLFDLLDLSLLNSGYYIFSRTWNIYKQYSSNVFDAYIDKMEKFIARNIRQNISVREINSLIHSYDIFTEDFINFWIFVKSFANELRNSNDSVSYFTTYKAFCKSAIEILLGFSKFDNIAKNYFNLDTYTSSYLLDSFVISKDVKVKDGQDTVCSNRFISLFVHYIEKMSDLVYGIRSSYELQNFCNFIVKIAFLGIHDTEKPLECIKNSKVDMVSESNKDADNNVNIPNLRKQKNITCVSDYNTYYAIDSNIVLLGCNRDLFYNSSNSFAIKLLLDKNFGSNLNIPVGELDCIVHAMLSEKKERVGFMISNAVSVCITQIEDGKDNFEINNDNSFLLEKEYSFKFKPLKSAERMILSLNNAYDENNVSNAINGETVNNLQSFDGKANVLYGSNINDGDLIIPNIFNYSLFPKELSPTSISCLVCNPSLFYIRYILNIKAFGSISDSIANPLIKSQESDMIFGNAFHKCCEIIANQIVDIDTEGFIKSVCDKISKDFSLDIEQQNRIKNFLYLGGNFLKKLHDNNFRFFTEEKLSYNITKDNTIIARPDLIAVRGNKAIVIDYKTGGKYFFSKEKSGESSQMGIAGLCLTKGNNSNIFGISNIEVYDLVYLLFKKKDGLFSMDIENCRKDSCIESFITSVLKEGNVKEENEEKISEFSADNKNIHCNNTEYGNKSYPYNNLNTSRSLSCSDVLKKIITEDPNTDNPVELLLRNCEKNILRLLDIYVYKNYKSFAVQDNFHNNISLSNNADFCYIKTPYEWYITDKDIDKLLILHDQNIL